MSEDTSPEAKESTSPEGSDGANAPPGEGGAPPPSGEEESTERRGLDPHLIALCALLWVVAVAILALKWGSIQLDWHLGNLKETINQEATINREAADAITTMAYGDPTVIDQVAEEVVGELANPDDRYRVAILQVLGEIHEGEAGEKALEVVAQAATDPSLNVRGNAYNVLRRMALARSEWRERAVEVYLAALSIPKGDVVGDNAPQSRSVAIENLAALEPTESSTLWLIYRNWRDLRFMTLPVSVVRSTARGAIYHLSTLTPEDNALEVISERVTWESQAEAFEAWFAETYGGIPEGEGIDDYHWPSKEPEGLEEALKAKAEAEAQAEGETPEEAPEGTPDETPEETSEETSEEVSESELKARELLERGYAAWNRSDPEQLVALAEEGLDLEPSRKTSMQLHVFLGTVHQVKTGDLEAALDHYDTVNLTLGGSTDPVLRQIKADAMVRMANIYYSERDDAQRALRLYMSAHEVYPLSTTAEICSQFCFRLGRNERLGERERERNMGLALSLAREAIELAPLQYPEDRERREEQLAKSQLQLAIVLWAQGEQDEALQMQASLDYARLGTATFYQQALLSVLQGDPYSALDYMNQFMETRSTVRARNQLRKFIRSEPDFQPLLSDDLWRQLVTDEESE